MDGQNGIGNVTMDKPPPGMKGNTHPAKGRRAGSAAPEATNPHPGVNVTFVTSGTGDPLATQTHRRPGLIHIQDSHSAGAGAPPRAVRNDQEDLAANPALLEIPPKAYEKIRDFLCRLEEEYDDDECNFRQYAEVISGDSYLGYRRVCNIVDAVPNPIVGGKWLKERIDKVSSGTITISEGSAQAIFQGMKASVQRVRTQWLSRNS